MAGSCDPMGWGALMSAYKRRWCIPIIALVLTGPRIGWAATNSYSFSVGAYVVAACSITAITRAAGAPCAPSSVVSRTPPPQPIVRLTRDPNTNVTTMTVEF